MKTRQASNKGLLMVRAGIYGLVVSLIITLVGSAITAGLVLNGRIKEESIDYYAYAILLVASIFAGIISCKKSGKQYALMAGIITILLAVGLLGINIFMFDSDFESLIIHLMMILIGCIGACLICVKGQGKRKSKRRNR